MTVIERSALLAHPVERVYELINDVEAYPEYMDGCVGAEIIRQSESEMVARLDLAKAGLKHSLMTCNRLEAPESVTMTLVEGPFSRFQGRWKLKALSDEACKVELKLEFELNSKLLAAAARALFNPMADNLVDALVKRANRAH